MTVVPSPEYAGVDVPDIAVWLADLGITTKVIDGFDLAVTRSPDRAVFVTMTGGGASIYERTFDVPTFQVRSRGLQRQPADAKALAWQVDNAITGVVPPTTVAGFRVIDIDRQGPPPRFADRDSANRAEWICNYRLTIARL